MIDREDLIQKIADEKGVEAVPILIDMLESEDSETRELVVDALSYMGLEAKDYMLSNFKKRFRLNKENDIVLLYLMEILADLECKEIIPYLERLLNVYSDERAFPLIIEKLLKLTKDKKYLDILETYLYDDGDTGEIALMAISNFSEKKTLDMMLKKYYNTTDKSIKAFVLDSILKVLYDNFELVKYLNEIDPELSKKLQWQLEQHNKN